MLIMLGEIDYMRMRIIVWFGIEKDVRLNLDIDKEIGFI